MSDDAQVVSIGKTAASAPFRQSKLVSIYEVLGAPFYRAEVVLPDGKTQNFEPVRAYTDMMQVMPNGEIHIDIKSSNSSIRQPRIRAPYHQLLGASGGQVLCALKRNIHHAMDSFALNYDLFCIDWKVCLIFHETEKGRFGFITRREDWESGGLVGVQGQEVQIFLSTSKHQPIPVGTLMLLLHGPFNNWLAECERECDRKKQRET